MSVIAAINAIQTLNATISPDLWAPQWLDYPPSLGTNNLPVVLTWPESWIIDPFESTLPLQLEFIVDPIDQGDFNQVKNACAGLMEAAAAVYAPYIEPGANWLATNPCIQIMPGQALRFSGILPSPVTGNSLSHPALNYHGFRLSLTLHLPRTGECC
ncbi:MAG: hypothetical protein FOGNACKC_00916 [Anaerolineae bacterium]|nr:hypothetical protein [Anaerolineae bacterium]